MQDLIPDVIPEEKQPFEPPEWYDPDEEYDDYDDQQNLPIHLLKRHSFYC